jgi:nicotinamide-nucleotide amidase
MWMKGKKAILVSMPGVPFEMKSLFKNAVVPRILEAFHPPVLLHRTLITYGLGESAIAERISDWQDALPPHMKLAYLPNLGRVRLRLSTRGSDPEVLKEELEEQLSVLRDMIRDILYGEEDGESLEETLVRSFTEKGVTLAAAESFTGGRIAAQITAVPGASAVFKGSLVCYASSVKSGFLGVPEALIREHSVVSAPVALEMARKAREQMQSDFAIATTGNAGPTKGDSDAPIGTVYIALAGPGGEVAETFMMGNHRERVVQKSVNKAFEMLAREILKI